MARPNTETRSRSRAGGRARMREGVRGASPSAASTAPFPVGSGADAIVHAAADAARRCTSSRADPPRHDATPLSLNHEKGAEDISKVAEKLDGVGTKANSNTKTEELARRENAAGGEKLARREDITKRDKYTYRENLIHRDLHAKREDRFNRRTSMYKERSANKEKLVKRDESIKRERSIYREHSVQREHPIKREGSVKGRTPSKSALLKRDALAKQEEQKKTDEAEKKEEQGKEEGPMLESVKNVEMKENENKEETMEHDKGEDTVITRKLIFTSDSYLEEEKNKSETGKEKNEQMTESAVNEEPLNWIHEEDKTVREVKSLSGDQHVKEDSKKKQEPVRKQETAEKSGSPHRQEPTRTTERVTKPAEKTLMEVDDEPEDVAGGNRSSASPPLSPAEASCRNPCRQPELWPYADLLAGTPGRRHRQWRRRRCMDDVAWSSKHEPGVACSGGTPARAGEPRVVLVWTPPAPATGRSRRLLAEAARWTWEALRLLALLHVLPAEEGLALAPAAPCAATAAAPAPAAAAPRRRCYTVVEPDWSASFHEAAAAVAAASSAADERAFALAPA